MTRDPSPPPAGTPTSRRTGTTHDLDVTVEIHDEVAHVRLDGELDMATAGVLEQAIARVLADPPSHVVVDLRGLAFMGSSGIAILHRLMSHEHLTVALVPGNRAIQRTLDISGMTSLLRFVEPPDRPQRRD